MLNFSACGAKPVSLGPLGRTKMNSVAIRRHAPLLMFIVCTVILVAAVEHQRYSAKAALTFESFGTGVLALVFLRKYPGPAIFNSDLPKLAGSIMAVLLALAVLFLVIAVITRIAGSRRVRPNSALHRTCPRNSPGPEC